jgi:hypothetical protein
MMEAIRTSETYVYSNQTTLRYIPEDYKLRTTTNFVSTEVYSTVWMVMLFWVLEPCSVVTSALKIDTVSPKRWDLNTNYTAPKRVTTKSSTNTSRVSEVEKNVFFVQLHYN